MKLRNLAPLTALTLLALTATSHAGGRWVVGVGIGFPGYYYRPYPVYAVPPPVYYMAPPPAVVYSAAPPPPVVVPAQPVPATPSAPAPADLPPPRRLDDTQLMSYEPQLRELTNPDERVRLDAVSKLGKARATRAVDPLAATLAGDPSPAVREAAAKALGLIGAPNAMPALRRAAQQDSSPDVRRIAQFSIEIIQSR